MTDIATTSDVTPAAAPVKAPRKAPVKSAHQPLRYSPTGAPTKKLDKKATGGFDVHTTIGDASKLAYTVRGSGDKFTLTSKVGGDVVIAKGVTRGAAYNAILKDAATRYPRKA